VRGSPSLSSSRRPTFARRSTFDSGGFARDGFSPLPALSGLRPRSAHTRSGDTAFGYASVQPSMFRRASPPAAPLFSRSDGTSRNGLSDTITKPSLDSSFTARVPVPEKFGRDGGADVIGKPDYPQTSDDCYKMLMEVEADIQQAKEQYVLVRPDPQQQLIAQLQRQLELAQVQIKISQPPITRSVDVVQPIQEHKLVVAALKRGDADDSQNAQFAFIGVLQAADLLQVALGLAVGTTEQESMLARLVRRWTSSDVEITTSLRTTFGVLGGSGSDMYDHVTSIFIDPMVSEGKDAEHDLLNFEWSSVFAGDGQRVHTWLVKLCAIVARLPRSRAGDAEYWIEHVRDRLPHELAAELDRHLRGQSVEVQQQAAHNFQAFSRSLAKAQNNTIRRSTVHPGASLSQHSEKPPKIEKPPLVDGKPPKADSKIVPKPSGGRQFNNTPCPDCDLIGCPKGAFSDAQCDVHGKPSHCHIWKMAAPAPYLIKYRAKLDEARAKAGKDAIEWPTCMPPPPPASSQSHQISEAASREAMQDRLQSDLEDRAAELDVYNAALARGD
jgi:hypothetical protein